MRTADIDQIVNEILTDMSHRENNISASADRSSVPDFEDTFGKLIQDDESSKEAMRKIWEELTHPHR
ncbi:hypothetical protein [Desulfosarcina sp.]|uniref:hypothetical protein n=1 Tax=Desulfosarcina sp. TaxID=2027861 RepID=UPI003568A603